MNVGAEHGVRAAIDAQGIIFTAGHTLDDLGAPNLGATDAFLRKLLTILNTIAKRGRNWEPRPIPA